jgi:superfamily II DNA/RNA helicase
MLTILETGRARARMPRTLILEPTRELAAQVEENFVRYGVNQKLSVALLIGGVSFGDQDAKITRGVDVLIATPGRLLDHVERGKLLLTGVELLVIDEADRMLDMGFIPDIERICKLVPFTRQTCSSRRRCRRRSPGSASSSCTIRCASRLPVRRPPPRPSRSA